MSIQKEQYVCGFLFDAAMQHLVLLRREKPPNQRGLYNGVGGRVEADEFPVQAMIRECHEEAGVWVEDWVAFAEVEGPTWVSYFFFARDNAAHQARQMEHQLVQCFSMDAVFSLPLMPNLPWLLRLCFDTSLEYAVVRVKG